MLYGLSNAVLNIEFLAPVFYKIDGENVVSLLISFSKIDVSKNKTFLLFAGKKGD